MNQITTHDPIDTRVAGVGARHRVLPSLLSLPGIAGGRDE
jgi:hypothetical protein